MNTKKKYDKLKNYISSLGSLAVSFSGGVDSALLLKTAHDVLKDNAMAITVKSLFFTERELEDTKRFCSEYGIRHIIIDLDVLGIEGVSQNPQNRCYICKTELFKKMRAAAEKAGFFNIAEGSNADDEDDYRPGMRAVKEQGILSPLRYAGLNKSEIREISKGLGLKTWNKPSLACLATRFVYGEEITPKRLETAETAECFLRKIGFECVRVRIHGNMARIETDRNEFEHILNKCDEISQYLKGLGFSYVSLDLEGYRTGSMNINI